MCAQFSGYKHFAATRRGPIVFTMGYRHLGNRVILKRKQQKKEPDLAIELS